MEKLFNECEVQNIDILISKGNFEIDVHWNCVDTPSKDNVDLRQMYMYWNCADTHEEYCGITSTSFH